MKTVKFKLGVHPSFRQQFDKLTEAYISGNVNPINECSCFVGNLLNGEGGWIKCRQIFGKITSKEGEKLTLKIIKEQAGGLYTPKEIVELEYAFLFSNGRIDNRAPNEDLLFAAFSTTLDKLKKLHISKGEIIDEEPILKKRELVTH